MPDDDGVEEIGGAIDLSRKFEFADLLVNGLVQAVSSNSGDTTQTITVHYKNIASLLASEVKTLTGLTPVAFAATMKSLMKAIKSATTVGDVAVEAQTAERTGTAQGAGTGTNTIQFDTGASAVDGFYTGMVCRITGGAGAGQIRRIINYTGLGKEAIVDRAWAVAIDGTSVFRISRGMVFEKAPHEAFEVRTIHYNARSDDAAGNQLQYFEKVFIKNTHPTETLSVALLLEASNPSGNMAFGLAASLNDAGTNGVGNNRQAFTDPPTFDNANKEIVEGGFLAPGDAQGVWWRLTLDPGEVGQKSDYSLQITGEGPPPPGDGIAVATGSYVGDGTGSKAITGLGFTPIAVFMKGRTDALSGEVYWKYAGLGGTNALKFVFIGIETDKLLSLDADGFTIGAGANEAGFSHYWIAFGADATVLYQGSYVGDGAATRSITAIGFQPDIVAIAETTGTTSGICKMTSMGGTVSKVLTGGNRTNAITSLDADGFSLGNEVPNNVNVTGRTYHFFAFKQAIGTIFQTSYVGNGIDDRDIVQGDPFAPKMVVVIKRTSEEACFRLTPAAVNQSWGFSGFELTNRIQNFNADGFEIGTNADVNTNLADYDYLSITGVPPPPPVEVVGPVMFVQVSWDLSLPISESATIVHRRRLLSRFLALMLHERTILATAPPLPSIIHTRSIFRAFLPMIHRRTIVPRSVILNAGLIESSEAQGGTLTTVILAPDASSTNGFYVDMWITIDGEERRITAYNGTTKTATVATLPSSPIAGTTYSITVAKPGASKVLRPFAEVTES